MDARNMSYSFVIPTLMLFSRETNRQIGIDRIHLLKNWGSLPFNNAAKGCKFQYSFDYVSFLNLTQELRVHNALPKLTPVVVTSS
jgi:hypothetical protein